MSKAKLATLNLCDACLKKKGECFGLVEMNAGGNITKCLDFSFDNNNRLGVKQTDFIEPDPEVEKDWDEFWKQLVTFSDGSLDVEQVKRELFDYHRFMRTAAVVYCDLTGNRISKINTTAEAILGEIHANEQREIDEAVKEAREEWEAEAKA